MVQQRDSLVISLKHFGGKDDCFVSAYIDENGEYKFKISDEVEKTSKEVTLSLEEIAAISYVSIRLKQLEDNFFEA